MTPAELKTELTTDPAALGYAPSVTAGNHNALAAMLNAIGTTVITLTSQTKGAVLLGIVPALDQLAVGTDLSSAAIPAAVSAKWQSRFQALSAGSDSLQLSPQFIGMLGQLVTDKLMTQAQVDAFTKRTGSRAEFLWGNGTTVSSNDVRIALGV